MRDIEIVEDRETELITESRSQFSTLTRAVLAKDPAATKRVADALGNFLGDGNALADLVHAALTDQGAFQKVLVDVLWAEAGELAEIEIKRKENDRIESANDNRIERATWAQLLH